MGEKTGKLSPKEHWRDCGEGTKIGEIINVHKNNIAPESVILVSHRSRKILLYLTACLLFSCICWSKDRYSLPLQPLAQSCPEDVMAAGALSIRLDVSFCPVGELAGSSCASPKTLTMCSSNSCHISLNASCFPTAALKIPGGMCVPCLWCPLSGWC